MARMYPPSCPSSAPPSEKIVFTQLEKLDDDFLVFHSVPWQGKRHGKQGDGEADFVIAHPNKGVLVLEVKGGGIEIEDGQWISQSRNGDRHSIRNPFEQAADSKFQLRDFLGGHIPRLRGALRCGHAVAFPDIEVAEALSSDGPREIILDRYELEKIDQSIGRALAHWEPSRLDEQQFAALRKALVPTTKVRRLLKHDIEDVVDELIELTEQQSATLRLLKRHRRALITGGAGTGKTVLAVEKAQQLADDGFSVLLLCFNAPLGTQLASQLAETEGITVGNFHKVAQNLVAEAGLEPEKQGDSYLNEQLPELFPAAAEKLGKTWDAVIVDEGQDFKEHWWTAIELVLSDPDDGIVYVFADSHQDLYQTGWAPPFDIEPFELDVNCRNTVEIAGRVNAVFDRDEPSLGVSGAKPKFIVAIGKKAAERVVKAVDELLDGGVAASEVVVLTQEREMADSLRAFKGASFRFVEAGKPGVVAETIHRFKGLEANAAIVWLDDIEDAQDRVLAYVGMSRARAALTVIGSEDVKTALDWSS